jgi:hypothetical protein
MGSRLDRRELDADVGFCSNECEGKKPNELKKAAPDGLRFIEGREREKVGEGS